MKNFFREDLDLNKKRWHRLVKVAWFISLFIIAFFCFLYIRDQYKPYDYRDKMVYQGTLRERLTNDVVDIKDVLRDGEYVSRYIGKDGDVYGLDELADVPPQTAYCSSSWNTTKIHTVWSKYFGRRVGEKDDLADNLVIELASNATGPCIVVLKKGYAKYDIDYSIGELYIYSIDTPNFIRTTLSRLLFPLGISVLCMLGYIIISMLIYYKGILYIIYGPKK